MDPDATLREIKAAIQMYNSEAGAEMDTHTLLHHLASHVEALDDWLSKGGTPPSAWLTQSGRRHN